MKRVRVRWLYRETAFCAKSNKASGCWNCPSGFGLCIKFDRTSASFFKRCFIKLYGKIYQRGSRLQRDINKFAVALPNRCPKSQQRVDCGENDSRIIRSCRFTRCVLLDYSWAYLVRIGYSRREKRSFNAPLRGDKYAGDADVLVGRCHCRVFGRWNHQPQYSGSWSN